MSVQRIVRWLVCLMACICGLLVGSLIWNVYRLVVEDDVAGQSLASVIVQDFTNPGWGAWLDLSSSVPVANPNATPKQTNTIDAINIKVRLVGIIGFGSSGIAIMQIQNGSEEVYVEGDSVADGVTLHSIRKDGLSITLSKGELTKEYSLPEIEGLVGNYSVDTLFNSSKNTSLIKPVAAESNQQTVATGQEQPTSSNNLSQQQANAFFNQPETKQKLQQIREKPMQAAELADTEFVKRDGKLYGVRIGNLHNPELFQAVGLSRNDIVIGVNGVSVADLASDPVGAQALLGESSYRIEIIRNGQNKIVNFSWPK